ncbi:MAG: HPF/RaiA family ribosome-associated protein [Treponema sp.]
MTTSIKAVDFTFDQKQSDLINAKIKRISYAEDLIVDLLVSVRHSKEFKAEATVNFRWGAQAHVSGEGRDFAEALNIMMDVLDNKIRKEKDKVQEKK